MLLLGLVWLLLLILLCKLLLALHQELRFADSIRENPTHISTSNLHYCFICVYDVDRPRNACLVSNPDYHMPNISCEEAHMYANQGASILAQHKSMPYVTGADMGWILANSISKAQFLMQHQQEFAK